MSISFNFICALSTSLFLVACMPVYMPDDIKKTVTINSEAKSVLRVCKNKEWYRLEKDSKGIAHISNGERITIGVSHFETKEMMGGHVTETCFPRLSFLPKSGNKYYLNFFEQGENCGIEVLRYSNKNQTGFTTEASVARDSTGCPE